jgi:hypothetical protein
MLRVCASVGVLLLTSLASASEVQSLRHSDLSVGQRFEIQTSRRLYRGQLVDRSTGECRMEAAWDGVHFGQPRTVFLLGATQGPQAGITLIVMHTIQVGLKMELGIGDLDPKHRYFTGAVKSIVVDRGGDPVATVRPVATASGSSL